MICIGVDWSGARGEFHRGIQVAEATAGARDLHLVPPPNPRGWSRASVIDHITHRAETGKVLAGIDFAFAHPRAEDGRYYPGLEASPTSAPALWQAVEDCNHDTPHLYGGGIWQHPGYAGYYNAPIRHADGRPGRGEKFASRRRLTEVMAARVNGRHPSPTFNCVGPAGVGTGSLAGMRLLHQLKDQATIWPFFMPEPSRNLILVEIFPSLYFTMAGVKDRAKKAAPLDELNRALRFFNTDPVAAITGNLPDHDDMDALVSAAAMRHLAAAPDAFDLPHEALASARHEGWIFGVDFAKE